jgi:hypothetical protein
MRLDTRALGLAASIVAAGLFILCAAAVAVAPDWTTAMAGTLAHLDLSGLARTLTWSSFFTGLVCWTVGTGLVFAALGALYNRFGDQRVSLPVNARHAA